MEWVQGYWKKYKHGWNSKGNQGEEGKRLKTKLNLNLTFFL